MTVMSSMRRGPSIAPHPPLRVTVRVTVIFLVHPPDGHTPPVFICAAVLDFLSL